MLKLVRNLTLVSTAILGVATWWFVVDQGYAKVQYAIGMTYAGGNGAPQDFPEAIKWWRLAAENGYAPAPGPDTLLHRGPVGVDVGDEDSRLARAVDLGGRRERHALFGHRVLQGGAL